MSESWQEHIQQSSLKKQKVSICSRYFANLIPLSQCFAAEFQLHHKSVTFRIYYFQIWIILEGPSSSKIVIPRRTNHHGKLNMQVRVPKKQGFNRTSYKLEVIGVPRRIRQQILYPLIHQFMSMNFDSFWSITKQSFVWERILKLDSHKNSQVNLLVCFRQK